MLKQKINQYITKDKFSIFFILSKSSLIILQTLINMDLCSRPDGYITNLTAYTNPIPTLPYTKTLHNKEDATLLQMTLKAFLKERLYGRLQSFDKSNKHNKNHLYLKQIEIMTNTRKANQQQKANKQLKNMYHESRNKNQSSISSYGCQINQLNGSSTTRISSKLKRKFETQQHKKGRFSLDAKSIKDKLSQKQHTFYLRNGKQDRTQRNMIQDTQKRQLVKNSIYENYIQSSFISAIQYHYQKQSQNNNELGNKKVYKLPLIDRKNNSRSFRLDLPKNPKLIQTKQQQVQLKISKQFWQLISKPIKQKTKKNKQFKDIKQQQIISRIKQTQQIRIKKKAQNLQLPSDQLQENPQKVRKNSFSTGVIGDSSKNSSIKADQNRFDKQLFKKYCKNQLLTVPLLLLTVFNFYQFSLKLDDKMMKADIEQQILALHKKVDRSWCVAIFKFLDSNQDSKIDSSDLFKIYNYLESLKRKIQQNLVFYAYQDQMDRIASSSLLMNSKKQIFSTNKKQISQEQPQKITSSNKNSLQRNKRHIKNELKTVQSQNYKDQSFVQHKFLIQKNYQNISKLQKQIENLTKTIIQKDKRPDQNKQKKNSNEGMRKMSNEKDEQKQILFYLQEALLSRNDLKFSDLNLILNDLNNQTRNSKKKVIQIDHKKLNIKLSSTYVQTFSATEHNQQTRVNRQYIQTLKDYIKNKQKDYTQNSEKLEKQTLPFLSYTEFYQSKYYQSFKQIFFHLVHSNIV